MDDTYGYPSTTCRFLKSANKALISKSCRPCDPHATFFRAGVFRPSFCQAGDRQKHLARVLGQEENDSSYESRTLLIRLPAGSHSELVLAIPTSTHPGVSRIFMNHVGVFPLNAFGTSQGKGLCSEVVRFHICSRFGLTSNCVILMKM